MNAPYIIARLVGPVMSVIGLGILINHDTYRLLVSQVLAAYPFVYFSGMILMLTGLIVLNLHNRWTRDWRSAITLFGWITTVVGAFRIVAPQFAVYVASGTFANDSFLTGVSFVLLAFGGFLTFKGYYAA